jgi:hypothetical protein
VNRGAAVILAAVLAVLPSPAANAPPISPETRAFLEDLEHRAFLYFWEQADPSTGLTLDRAGAAGGRAQGPSRNVASSAATGFALTALCIGAEHGWITRPQALERVHNTLRFFASKAFEDHGWFYHWMHVESGERQWDSEISSIDTALLLAGVLTAGQCFASDRETAELAHTIYNRVDFPWMLNGDHALLSHGFKPGKGFIKFQWSSYSEASILYLLGIGSPTHPLPQASWYAWSRPQYTYGSYQFISGGPLFTHQFSHAWIDFRNRRDRGFIDFFQNSIVATRANRLYCVTARNLFPLSFSDDIWGITASDSPKGYKIYGELAHFEPVDGTVAPCAPGGSLMFTPDISVAALRAMREQYGDSVYRRYGFIDAYNPGAKWFDSDVIGIDVGITLLSAENLLTGKVWQWFMGDGAVPRAMDLAGFSRPAAPAIPTKRKPVKRR